MAVAANTVTDVPPEEDSEGADERNDPGSNTQKCVQGHVVPGHHEVEDVSKGKGQRQHPSEAMRAV
jgi:hypothetical protein